MHGFNTGLDFVVVVMRHTSRGTRRDRGKERFGGGSMRLWPIFVLLWLFFSPRSPLQISFLLELMLQGTTYNRVRARLKG